jgi:hypothetical protein
MIHQTSLEIYVRGGILPKKMLSFFIASGLKTQLHENSLVGALVSDCKRSGQYWLLPSRPSWHEAGGTSYNPICVVFLF